MSARNSQEAESKPQAWWRFGHVWMVVAGPAIVVVASVFTFYLAVSHPDPVMDQNYYQTGIELNKHLGGNPNSLAPAVQARNHAATGVPKPADSP